MKKPPTQSIKIAIPIVVLSCGIAGAWALVANRPELEPKVRTNEAPWVETITVQPQTLKINIRSQGIVKPREELTLVPEVAGKIVRMHPNFVPGGFFEAGELLIAIDPRDYDHAVAAAEAAIAEARRQVLFEEAQAEQAQEEWQALGEGQSTPLAMHEPQLAEARAKLKSAESELANAKLRRSRCDLFAPFAGRVVEKQAGIGQYVQIGDSLARLFATDAADVRLPVPAEQLGFLPFDFVSSGGGISRETGVMLSADIAGARHRWQGRIVRAEATVDETTGLLHLIAEIRNPYQSKQGGVPLLAGLFVQAEIEGREQHDVFELPVGVLNSMQEALVIDGDRRLHIRRLDVLRRDADRIWIESGLTEGEQVVISGVPVPVEGMKVRVQETTPEMPADDRVADAGAAR